MLHTLAADWSLNMSEALSQEEIDAILKGSNIIKDESGLIAEESQALSEICNISIGAFSEFLFSKLKKKVTIQTSGVSYLDGKNTALDLGVLQFVVSSQLSGRLAGSIFFAIKMDDVAVINDLLMGGNGEAAEDMGDIPTQVVLGVMKDVIPMFVEKISEVVEGKISSDTAEVFFTGEENSNLRSLISDNKMAQVVYDLDIGGVLKSKLIQLLPMETAKELIN